MILNGETVFLQDSDGKWTIRAVVINRRKHQGVESSSYMLKKSKTGHMTCRNEHSICRFEGGVSDPGTDTLVGFKEDTLRTGNNSAMYINILHVHPLYRLSLKIVIPFMLTGFPLIPSLGPREREGTGAHNSVNFGGQLKEGAEILKGL